MNIGARTLKTGIAVGISVYICILLNIGLPFFAATSAVVCMQQSIGKGLRDSLDQIIANILGIVIGFVLGMTIPIQPLSMAIATILVIIICTKVLKAPNQIVLAVITAIIILGSPQDQFVSSTITRSYAVLIGMAVANVINLIIAPPRYHKILVGKLIELNHLSVQAFVDSVNRYLHLNTASEEEITKNKTEFKRLFHETDTLFDLYRSEWNITFKGKTSDKKTMEEQLFKEYLNYNRGLWQRSQDLLFLVGERKMRREEADDPGISSEFNQIFEMLHHVMYNATSYNLELQKKIRGEEAVLYPEPRVWSKLNEILNEWQENTPSTSFYMHALIEVSVVTYNIRWFAKESYRLISDQ